MQITINGKWQEYPPDWHIIGKHRVYYYLTLTKEPSPEKSWGYSSFYYDCITYHSFGLGPFSIYWGKAYEIHKNNK